jgi:hypothetical protein
MPNILLNQINDKILLLRIFIAPLYGDDVDVLSVDDGAPALENFYQLEFGVLHAFQ